MDRWLVIGDLGGNKMLLERPVKAAADQNNPGEFHVEYKTSILENVKVGDTLTQELVLEDASPEEIKQAGITIDGKTASTITPDSEFGTFLIGKLYEALLKKQQKEDPE